MTKVSQTILLKRWSLFLREFLDMDMVEDLKANYGDELEEADTVPLVAGRNVKSKARD